MKGFDPHKGNSLLKEFLDSGMDEVESGSSLFEYLSTIKTNTVKYKGILYVLSLVYYQDIPQYNIIEVDNNNKLFL